MSFLLPQVAIKRPNETLIRPIIAFYYAQRNRSASDSIFPPCPTRSRGVSKRTLFTLSRELISRDAVITHRNSIQKQPRGVTKRCMRTITPKDFAPSSKSIENVLVGNNCEYKHGHTSFVSKCFSCHGVGKSGEESKLTLFVNEVTGSYVCKNCGIHGSWSDLTDNLNQWRKSVISPSETGPSGKFSDDKAQHFENEFQLGESRKMVSDLPDNQIAALCNKYGLQKISKDTLEKYFVTVGSHEFSGEENDFTDENSLIFPIFDLSRKLLIGAKFFSSNKTYSELKPSGGCSGLFGWHTIKPSAKKLVLTANEFDALAVYESTQLPSMAIPSHAMTLPPEVLPQLEQFDEIVLWFENNIKSMHALNQISRKLGMHRCSFIRNFDDGSLTSNGPLEALQQDIDLETVIARAFPVSHPEILTFDQLRHDLLTELTNAEQAAGVKWRRFPLLNSVLKGHRRGELTIFTGPTGAGKTTLLSELSLDLAMQGVSTLWGSFEVRNVRLLRTLLNQFSGLEMESNLDQYDRWASKLESLPLYFMDFYGSQSLQTVLETMNHASYVHDVEHVIIDNLQFMTDGKGAGKYDDTFYRMNNALSAFRKFATYKNVHVTLVIHPRKENDNVDLQTASVFGTAKATQEADNVLILQNGREGGKFLEVTKNRYDGSLGKIPLTFHRSSLALSGFYRDQRTKEPGFYNKSDFLERRPRST